MYYLRTLSLLFKKSELIKENNAIIAGITWEVHGIVKLENNRTIKGKRKLDFKWYQTDDWKSKIITYTVWVIYASIWQESDSGITTTQSGKLLWKWTGFACKCYKLIDSIKQIIWPNPDVWEFFNKT